MGVLVLSNFDFFIPYFIDFFRCLSYHIFMKNERGFFMISSDFRTDARRKLDGKWGKAVCIVLASLLISIAINAIQSIFPDDSLISSVASLAAAIIEVPIQFGLIFAFLKLFLGEDVKAFDFFEIRFF